MQIFTANDAKQKFGLVMDSALQEPITITKHGRPSVVITSDAEYKELLRLKHQSLKDDVVAGFQSLDQEGGVSIASDDDLAKLMNQVKRRGRQKLASKES